MKNKFNWLKKVPFNNNVLFILFLIPFIAMFIHTWHLDNDGWFLFNHGRYVLENGFPYIEPFTMHQNFNFIMQQWLSAIIIYLPYKYFGTMGVFVLIMCANALLIFVLYKLCMLISDNNKTISIIITTIINTLMANYGFIVSRPQVFSYIVILVFLYFLEKYIKTGNNKLLIALPLLSVLEINLHASTWWMLIILYIPFIVDGIYNEKIKKNKLNYSLQRLIICFAIVFMFGIINPYGVDAMTYLFNSVNKRISELIIEMRAANILDISVMIIFLFLIINIIAHMKYYKKNNRVNFTYLLLMVGFLMISLHSKKAVVYSYIFSIYPLAYFFKDFKLRDVKLSIRSKSIYAIIWVIVIGITGWLLYSNVWFIQRQTPLLEKPVDYLLENYDKDKMTVMCLYDHGGYLEYRGLRPFIDQRAEVFLDSINKYEDIFKEYYLMRSGIVSVNELLDKYNITHVLVVGDYDYLYTSIDESKYDLVYDENVKIYARKLDI